MLPQFTFSPSEKLTEFGKSFSVLAVVSDISGAPYLKLTGEGSSVCTRGSSIFPFSSSFTYLSVHVPLLTFHKLFQIRHSDSKSFTLTTYHFESCGSYN